MRPKIDDVARLAQVSIKTVSRVLNNELRVAEDTRARVHAAVATLNYRPSFAARSLAGHRSFQIALACDNPSPYYVYEMQSGVRDRCVAEGVRMIAQPYDHDSDQLAEDIESLVATSGVDGLILTPPATDYAQVLDLIARHDIRFVLVSPGSAPDLTASVFIDNAGAAAAMMRHLLALGHRRIGFICGHGSYATSDQRLAGYRSALDDAGIAFDPALVRPGNYDFAAGVDAGEALLALAAPPTAIFAANDEMAAGMLSVAHHRGLSVPNELSIAGFGDDAVARFVWPPLTTIRQPVRRMGYEAADLLLAPDFRAERREIPFELIRRQSTGPARSGG